jgi:hypothetical protein
MHNKQQDFISTLRLLLGVVICLFTLSILSIGEVQSNTSLGLLSFIGLIAGLLIFPDSGA